MVDLWIHPTAIDVTATRQAAQHVRLVPPPSDPHGAPIPALAEDWPLRDWAGFILAHDAVDLLRAYSRLDFSGEKVPSCTNWAFATLRQNPGYDIEQELRQAIQDLQDEGRVFRARLPDFASDGEFHGSTDFREAVPRGTVGAILPEMERNTASTRYAQDSAVRRGTLLNQLRALRQAQSAAVDAGLAALAAANWTAARADLLARSQAMYPSRGYL